ncbi:hypothetical protein GCM10010483_03800 [Actinokineospora diospyrosa]
MACWLGVAVTTVAVFTTGMAWWTGALIEAAVVVFLLPLGFVLWSDAGEHKSDTERLLRDGKPATAEVVEVELVDPGDGSPDVAVLRLRISGADVPPFETTYRGDADPEFRIGALLYATVDPADNLFTLRRLHTP